MAGEWSVVRMEAGANAVVGMEMDLKLCIVTLTVQYINSPSGKGSQCV